MLQRLNYQSNIRQTGFSGSQAQPDNNVLYDTKFLQMKKAPSPNGKADWVYAHRPNSKDVVVIAPIIHEKEGDSIVFLETERPPIKAEGKASRCIELPAGLVGDEKKGESVQEALEKELKEETGYKADEISIQAKNIASSPGSVSETSTIAIADITKPPTDKPIDDGGVIKAVHKVPINKVMDWLKEQSANGKAISSQACTGLLFALSRINGKQD